MNDAGSSPDNLRSRYRAAVATERAAWRTLAANRPGHDPEKRAADLQRWVDSHRDLREVQQMMTNATVAAATVSMRDSAAVLASDAPPTIEASIASTRARAAIPAPMAGQCFVGRGNSQWRVVAVTQDALEPGYYLAQVERREPEHAGEDAYDVYSDDWILFCIVHGLQPMAPANHA